MKRHKKDHIGIWFEQRRNLGVNDNILMARSVSNETTQKIYQHADMDGVSCLMHFFDSFGLTYNKPPLSKAKNEPGRQEFKAIKKCSENYETRIQWQHWNPEKHSKVEHLYSALFTLEQTQAIQERVSIEKTSLNTWLFWTLNKACAEKLIKPSQSYSWFYPVNLRGAIDYKTLYSNYSSGFYLSLNSETSLSELSNMIRKKLKTGQYWVSWRSAKVSQFLPGFILRMLYRYLSKKQFYAGSFSSLGEWTAVKPKKESRESCKEISEDWFACAPGTANYPISNGILICNGKLSCTLKLHPAITKSHEECREVLQCWSEYLLCGTPQRTGSGQPHIKIIHSTIQ